ncbi:MAG: hypothetical protein RLZZ543_1507 [Bacteroidota bacterium]|jgi:hypothetical protein
MTWEKCYEFGYIELLKNGSMKLYYDQFNGLVVSAPVLYMTIHSAIWQGKNLIVRGVNQYNEPLSYVYSSVFNFSRL